MNDFLTNTLNGEQPSKLFGETLYFHWKWIECGILQLTPLDSSMLVERDCVLSAGIHGNETCGVEILNQLLQNLFANTIPLKCRLLVIFGNIDALRANKRFLFCDMNRMFGGRWQNCASSCERDRAALLEEAVVDFWNDGDDGRERWHLDLHTTFKGSYQHTSFGILPARATSWDEGFLGWLGTIVEALVFHQSQNGTFSNFSSQFNAFSCTVELETGPHGKKNFYEFNHIQSELEKLISGGQIGKPPPDHKQPAIRYKVKHQITRQREEFNLYFPLNTLNFTPFTRGTLIAQDGDSNYIVQNETEYILFPNPARSLGKRAGLMLVKEC
ncbi:hypothetical protein CYY_006848 [Polysphondylium violaceum]|uniref:Succinylglutamate desuccinylase n=1 Tax=Polysphondylium violaceum TaxID=133409 RepID=A0A8J4PYT9_9MYCE|nr:hypothetical protein CYY_006848 [Polysphondylium violaceum]